MKPDSKHKLLRKEEKKKRKKKHKDGHHKSKSSKLNSSMDILSSDGSPPRKKRAVNENSDDDRNAHYEPVIEEPNVNELDRGHDVELEHEPLDTTEMSLGNPKFEDHGSDHEHDFNQYEDHEEVDFLNGSEELNKEQQERLLAAANAMVEEEMLPTYLGSENLITPDSTEPSVPIGTVDQSGIPSSQKFLHKKSSQVELPELPKHNYDNIRDLDDLILVTSQRANKWFVENVPEDKRGKPRPFTDQEDAIIDYYLAGFCHFKKWDRNDLCNRIWTNDRTKDKFWKKVCKAIPYRSQSSIYKHIRRRYHIFDVRAKWNPEDDEKLKNLAVTHESQWKTIGEILGRMPEDCRDRWRNYLKCGSGRTLQKWTSEEEAKLVDVVNEMLHSLRSQEDKAGDSFNINWTVVSERMNGTRSRIQCRYKWTQLNEKRDRIEPPKMRDATKAWLLQKLLKKHPKTLEKVKWQKVMKSYAKDKPDNAGWTKEEFEEYLSNLIKQKPDNLSFQEVIKDEVENLKSS
ncbi:hypothetical protein I9W82_001802 [Candida metapsilosis]|uniref:RNA polymerase I termination factor n=1 Tax=Candida metapsilosis TaxID=273372 RepID=A0A8H7ZDG9_9ASCO|nr:hypothetical protein I9W82_001802 [Candida metapsilosis]